MDVSGDSDGSANCVFTALAAMTYYRRRITSSAWDFVTVGMLPLAAAGFLGWIFVKSVGAAPTRRRPALSQRCAETDEPAPRTNPPLAGLALREL